MLGSVYPASPGSGLSERRSNKIFFAYEMFVLISARQPWLDELGKVEAEELGNEVLMYLKWCVGGNLNVSNAYRARLHLGE
jgi:hypothetical protein